MKTEGFTLVEILLSLLIMAGSITALLGGLNHADSIARLAKFEHDATLYAERELETFKADLMSGKRSILKSGKCSGRFKIQPGWKTELNWSRVHSAPERKNDRKKTVAARQRTDPGSADLIRISCSVSKGTDILKLESMIYIPE